MRNRFYKAYKAQSFSKTNKTFDLIGCSHYFFKSWNIHGISAYKSIDSYGSVWCIDQFIPIKSFTILDEIELQKNLGWENLGSM